MEKLKIPSECNYIAVFLTMRCNLVCPYCINRHGEFSKSGPTMVWKDWVDVINNIETRPDLPITLQGGEPTQYPSFWDVVHGIRQGTPLDLLTNLHFNVDTFMTLFKPDKFKRDAPYASIRVSYHPGSTNHALWASNLIKLSEAGYSVGVWLLNHPKYEVVNNHVRGLCKFIGVDCRMKDFLGNYEGKMYGTYQYPGAVDGPQKKVECCTNELLISETGHTYKCHSDLYARRDPTGHILNKDFKVEFEYRNCDNYGRCNPCDLKVKNNRFQQFGHCAVSIRGTHGN